MAKQQLPGWVDFSGWLNRGTKYAPTNVTLPDNKLLAVYKKRADVSNPVGTGGIQYSADENVSNPQRWQLRSAIDVFGFKQSGKGHNGDGGYGAQNLTIADAERCATLVENIGLEGDQFGEGFYAMPDYGADSNPPDPTRNSSVLYKAYYRKRRQMYQQAGISPRIYGSYGSSTHYDKNKIKWDFNGPVLPTDSSFRQWYESSAKAQQSCDYFQKIELDLVNLMGASVKHYMVDFNYAINYYMAAHSMEIMRLGMGVPVGGFPDGNSIQGGLCPLFIWGNIETLVKGKDDLHNGLFYERPLDNPKGTVRTSEHPLIDFDHTLAMCFAVGFVRGSGVIAWDNGTLYGNDPNRFLPLNSGEGDNKTIVEWVSDGGEYKPVAGQTGTDYGYPDHPLFWHDAVLVASEWYAACSHTAGEQWKYVRYRYADSST